MQLALISDIHANLEALTAVLDHCDEQQVERIYCLGDVIGYGADPVECLDLVSQRCELILMGNHEYASLGLVSTQSYNEVARTTTEWTRGRMGTRETELMADLPMDHIEDGMHFVHSSPFEPDRWHYIVSPESALLAFQHLDGQICFFGHSHVPMVFEENPSGLPYCYPGESFVIQPEKRYLVNIGSVGQPRDNDPRAAYAIVDTDANEVLFHRVAYDISLTQERMAQAELPEPLISRLAVGR